MGLVGGWGVDVVGVVRFLPDKASYKISIQYLKAFKSYPIAKVGCRVGG